MTLRRRWPLLALLVLLAAFLLMLLFSRKAPVIASIDPSMAAPGEVVTLTGDYFGRTAREGQLTLSGLTPPPSKIQEWTDQKIVFQVPEDAPSGLVTVANSQGISASVLFTNTRSIPTVLKSRAETTVVEITYVLPSAPLPGQIVTLGGRGFGRGDNGSWLAVRSTPEAAVGFTLSPAQTSSWSDLVITFALPPGWGPTSIVTVHTPRGESRAVPVGSTSPVLWEAPRDFPLEFVANVTVKAGLGTLRLLPPLPQVLLAPAEGPGLRITGVSSNVSLPWRLKVTTWSKRWVGWSAGQVVPPELQVAPPQPPAPDSPWKSTPLLKPLVAGWGLDAADQWLRAKHLLGGVRLAFHRGSPVNGAASSAATLVSSRLLTPWEVSSLVLVVGRQAGLGVRTVQGFYLGDSGDLRPHAWVQIWIPGASWVDVDPWFLLDSQDDKFELEFGSLDSRHLPWSVGPIVPPRGEPGSRAVSGSLEFSSQTLLAEVTGTLEVLPPQWNLPTVVPAAAP